MKKNQEKKLEKIKSADEYPTYKYILCKNYLKDFPKSGRGWVEYGRALTKLRRYKEAKSALEKSIELYSGEYRHYPYSFLGRFYRICGDYEKAIIYFKKCVLLLPQEASYHIFLGGVLAKSGKLKESEESHRKGITCSQGYVDEAFLNLGYVLRAQEKYEEALECFVKAVEIDSEYEAALEGIEDIKKVFALSEFLEENFLDEEREKRLAQIKGVEEGYPAYKYLLCREYVDDFPNSTGAWANYGGALIDLARYREARGALKRSIELCPEEWLGYPYSFLGTLYKFCGDYERAIICFKKCISLDSQEASDYVEFGSVLVKNGNLKEAKEIYKKGTTCSQGAVDEVFLNFGYVLRIEEKYEEALKCFIKALEISPEYKEALLAIEDIKKVFELEKKAE